jgi:hypothetical protein
VICEVQVFLLEVKHQRTDWPEKEEREVQWFSLNEAAKAVQEAALSDIILSIPDFPKGNLAKKDLQGPEQSKVLKDAQTCEGRCTGGRQASLPVLAHLE